MDDELRPAIVRVLDPAFPLAASQRPRISYLATRLGVGGGAVKHDLDGLPLAYLAAELAVDNHGENMGRRRQRCITKELRLGHPRRELLVHGGRPVAAV